MRVIINQPFGIGDILFLTPLVRQLDVESGIWPIVDHYYWIKDYLDIPNISFIQQSQFNRQEYHSHVEIPFQHAHSHVPQAQDCMQAKYMLLEASTDLWRTLSFKRNREQEEKLKQHLNISSSDRFVFINNNFAGPEFNYKTDIEVDTNDRIVYQEYVPGFTLLDWCGVLEQASEIHTVSTALFFVIESMKLEQTPIHLYPRKPLDIDLSPIKTLISSRWICHE